MKIPALLVFATFPLALPGVLSAQEAPPPAPPSEAATPGAPAEAAPPAPPSEAATPAPAEAVPPPEVSARLEERVAAVEGKLEGLSESVTATQATTESLSKIKLSGYVQGRFEWHDDADSGLNAQNRPAETNRFFVRRGRLKATYGGTNAEYMLQVDATGDGVSLRDAEATFVDTWTPLGLRLTVGQFKWPFGYEVLQSSSEREMPERSLVVRRLFPGERDRGLRLQARHEWLRFAAALVNGNGTGDAIYGTFDQTSFKDLVGRVGGDFGLVVLGASGYWGHTLKTGTDVNGDGRLSSSELSLVSGMPPTYERYSRLRLGADAQLYVDVAAIGGLALKGEIIWARDSSMDFGGGLPEDPCRNETSLGWYVTAVQNLGDHLAAVIRVDQFDRNSGVAEGCSASILSAAAADKVTTLGGGILVHASANLRATLVYEHPIEQEVGAVNNVLANDTFTAQLQTKF
jgi:hypothetical protein